MGSDAHVVVVGGHPRLADEARARIDQLEQRWSRFLPDSEVTQLNRQAGTPVTVSPDTIVLVERAAAAWRFSGGAFDPTVLGSVIRAGYDRSFDRLMRTTSVDGTGPTISAGRSPLGIGAADIRVEGSTVRLPEGTGFDPGGIGKGLAADLVVDEILDAGAEGACVNLGGDVRVAGIAPDGGAWTVAVEHPWSEEPLAYLGVAAGAVATSTTLRRRWVVDGTPRHHLIDPRSGLPSPTDVNLATVVAAEAWVAEALAKSVLLRGSAHPFDVVDGTAAQALAVDDAGGVHASHGLGAFLGERTLPLTIAAPGPRIAQPV